MMYQKYSKILPYSSAPDKNYLVGIVSFLDSSNKFQLLKKRDKEIPQGIKFKKGERIQVLELKTKAEKFIERTIALQEKILRRHNKQTGAFISSNEMHGECR